MRAVAAGDDRELLELRIAECDYFTKRTRNATEALRGLSDKASRKGEALFFYALASRDAGDTQTFLQTLNRVKTEFPDQTWAEDALNNLGTYYIKTDDDEQADAMFREMYERYPRGNYAERAAWKIGWTSYRKDAVADTARVFERAASDFPRSDYRPAWIYWAGRAHEQLGEPGVAQQRYTLAAADYANSYYGRLAMKRLDPTAAARIVAISATVEAPPSSPGLPANGSVVRALLAVEIRRRPQRAECAQRVWGDSPAIGATVAWTRQQH